MSRRPVYSAALLTVLSAATSALGADARDKVFVGYLYGSTRGVDFKLYTHLCHAFLLPDADGGIKKNPNVPNKELAADAHKAGVKVLVSLGGWGFDEQFAAIVSKPEAEDRYVKAVLEAVDGFDYDGIDLDWEYPDTAKEIEGFERLCRRFRKELDAIGSRKGRPMFLTMAASANPGTLKWLGKEFLLETMDWLNVMTYDYAGEWSDHAGHNSPLFASTKPAGRPGLSTEKTMKYLLEQRDIPADRLAVGIPLYGRGFAVAEPYAPTKGAPRIRMPQGNFNNLERLRKDQGWTRTWDDETKNPWLLSPDHKIVIGYDDAESVRLKADWAAKQGFRGVFFWQIGADRMADGSHPLQEAARRAWDEGAEKVKP